MKIIAFGDIHEQTNNLSLISDEIASADLIVITGDLTQFGGIEEATSVLQSLTDLNPKILAQAGNLDVFFDDEDRQFYLDTLKRYNRRWGLNIWAYCLMTNHVHILASPGTAESLPRGIGGTNLVYTTENAAEAAGCSKTVPHTSSMNRPIFGL